MKPRRAGEQLAVIAAALVIGCGEPPSPNPPSTVPSSATTTAPVASTSSAQVVASAKPPSEPKKRGLSALDGLGRVEELFRGELGGAPVVVWVQSLPGAAPNHYTLSGRLHRESEGEDTLFHGVCDQDGHLSLDLDGGGTLRDDAGVDMDRSDPTRWKLVFRGLFHKGAQELRFQVTQVRSDDLERVGKGVAEIVHRRLRREADVGKPNHCLVDVDYVEILGGLSAFEREKVNRLLNPLHDRWGGKCAISLSTTGKDVVVTNEANVLSIRSERLTTNGTSNEPSLRFVTRLLPGGDEVKLADILEFTPGTPALSKVLEPAFTKALGGNAKKAREMMKRFNLGTKDPIEPADCLLTPTSVHFVWADRNSSDPASYPSEEGAVLDLARLRKAKALSFEGRLGSFAGGE